MDQPSDIVHKALLAQARDEEAQGARRGPVVLSAALSKALLYINRLRQGANIPTRILCLLASPDASAQYIALMNCIFAAQVREEWELGGRGGEVGGEQECRCMVCAHICAALAPYYSILFWVNFLDA